MAETAALAGARPTRIAGSPQAVLVVDDEGALRRGQPRRLPAARGRAQRRGRPAGSTRCSSPSRGERFAADWPAFAVRRRPAPGPFALEAPASVVEVGATVTARILPSRHLVTLDPGRTPRAAALTAAPRVGLRAVREPSAREREILALLADGATDGQIADLLELSPATVQTHVRNAKAKLGARTRAQAVAIALQRGLIRSSGLAASALPTSPVAGSTPSRSASAGSRRRAG